MTATTPLAVAAALLALTLAGCTGSFNVDQTEPIRVQLEGQPQTVTVRDTDAEAKRVEVATDCETTCDHEEVEVQLEVHKVASGPCKILVTIQGDDGTTIVSRVIDVDVNVDNDGDDGTTTTGNGTTAGNTTTTATTATGSAGGTGTTVQNIVVNVKGNKNIIVLTQAQEGSADVNVQAIKATGNADVDSDVDQGDDDGMTTSSSSTTTSSGNMTTTSP